MADIYYDRGGWWIATDCLPIGPFETVSEAERYMDGDDDPDFMFGHLPTADDWTNSADLWMGA